MGIINASDVDDLLAEVAGPTIRFPADTVRSMVDSLKQSLGPATTDITPEQMERRTAYTLTLGLPSLCDLQDQFLGQTAIICGGGPSLDMEAVRAGQAAGAKVFAVNTVHDALIAAGIIPDFAVMLDPNARVAGYQTPHPKVTYLIGSTVHPRVWQRFREADIRPYLFVPTMTDYQHITLAQRFEGHNLCFVTGGVTVGMRTPHVTGFMGFLDDELHGFDSCYAPGQDGINSLGLYSVPKPVIRHDSRVITITSNPSRHRFTCRTNGSMGRQLASFRAMLHMLPVSEVNGRVGQRRIRVAGDGAIPWMAWKDGGPDKHFEHTNPERMEAKYGSSAHWDYFGDRALR